MSEAAAAPLCGCARARHAAPLAADETLRRVVAIDDHAGWSEIYCRSTGCGRRGKVERDSSYRFPT